MKALRIDGLESCSMAEVPDPHPGPGEVLVDVRHVGLCGSDLATFTGLNPLVSLPRIPGHELGVVILQAGRDVPAAFAAGRRAVVMPYTACGSCSSCRAGRVNACRHNRTLGVQQDGGLSERFVLPFDKLILNDTLLPRHLALVEPLSVGFHAVNRGRITATDTVVVLGCGMIGMGAVIGAVARGARVIAVDFGDKTRIALTYGATHSIDPASQDVAAVVAELTGGDGADVVIEAVGLPATFTQAIDLVCYGGRVVYIGYSKAPVSYETRFFNLKELDILGSRNALRADFDAVIAWMEARRSPPDDLITRVFPFVDAAEALPAWVRDRAMTLKFLIER
jgi:2-desacetyl-2-hydroxyethyl bacteriochlorophyllide A dehydrogenase